MTPRLKPLLVAAAALLPTASIAASSAGIIHEPLPYSPDALEPHVSSETFSYHHGKHYAKYVKVANAMVESLAADKDGVDLVGKSADEVFMSAKERGDGGLFNNAAQAYNHAFFFKCMKPGGGGVPAGKVKEMIDEGFGSFVKFREEFAAAAVTAFGSGWAWLCLDPVKGKLVVIKTIGAGNPLTDGLKPILTLDVWEHAYYIDYRNARDKFVDVFLEKLVDWEFANANLKSALGGKDEL